AFESASTNLDTADTSSTTSIYVRDLQTNSTTLVSRATGTGASAGSAAINPAISADGRVVVFESGATNLDPGDTDTTTDVYVRDLQTNETTLASRAVGAAGAKGNGASSAPSISADGLSVAFHSAATNLAPDDTDTTTD